MFPPGPTGFLYFLVDGLLGLLVLAIIVNAIMSWLVAFDVINYRNGFVANVGRFLDAVTAPVLRPLQKVIPPLGGMDITPIIALLVIEGVRRYLLPPLFTALYNLIG